MCGIVGVTGNKNATSILVNGLEKLQYRGYDSAGIFVDSKDHKDYLVKTTGSIDDLKKKIGPEVQGTAGIGHTRWATHGGVNIDNAHPQFSDDDRFYLVHNGVIENYEQLKKEYLPNVKFHSQTDTEVAVQLVDKFVTEDGMTTKDAFIKMLSLLKNSSYAFILMDRDDPDTLYAAKNKSPMLIGLCDGFNVVCSDSIAMLDVTDTFLEVVDGDVAIVKPDSVTVLDEKRKPAKRNQFKVTIDPSASDKGTYPYYMLKEIDEQPNVMRKLVKKYFDADGNMNVGCGLMDNILDSDRIYIVGAGTSYHAGLVGKELMEKYTGIPTEVHVSSEFAYEEPLLPKKPFFIFLTQSGETADSREVLVNVNKQHFPSLTITNVANSTLSREATYTMLLNAGPEISVASTKAYTAQIAIQAILAKAVGMRGNRQVAKDFDLGRQLGLVATGMQSIVEEKDKIDEIAKKYFVNAKQAFYIGRGVDYTVSLEAALKLKEISYVHAEGFASGELKHGTIALIEKGTPVIGIITQKKTAGLTHSNLEETAARGANALTIVRQSLAQDGDTFVIPDVDELLTPLLSVIPAQLIAYYTSLNKGLNVDRPRNLAKSVTVE
ncbi:glutamine--fructose-6-phosphate transaminase (isomerizing) [Fructilactobacillus fructivorans]|uniref:Glutamine--fructose-6-phosphate aminotransferase [isomerizing] n=1 Tax=Fructilactobacillus fructivorans TaxID=1614 RepID=A0A0C1PLL6_9LACO|nr:glutamine--fructose-6-phosphate transaminase (isomerizing) [Fructilactobacillus fructivorans]KID41637.1 Glucosamine--fructose-6-phosphate aminotransferase [isomerizing] [Fructilactobacillus fructivorans]MCT0151288.1 glutamine--fructose-6-phosphate transaminase (isomerizing) [Fructilactobacillus fructivorans]MCT2867635.1 glutamine--fructose-6-phosphate transaminase (isomerizing) [Fructilactobacillus fructivorans]MCT2868847.1 glutamine--fructose-6-phosphate transaminase (isomerizing) [Fructila